MQIAISNENIDHCFQTFFYEKLFKLQTVAKSYKLNFSQFKYRDLARQQRRINRLFKNWHKSRSLAFSVHDLIDKTILSAFYVKQILKQKVLMSDDLKQLRLLFKQRNSFVNLTRDEFHFLQLNVFRIVVLETLTAHLIDNIAKKFCSRCCNDKEQFFDCVVITSETEFSFFDDKCTNCVLIDFQCSLRDISEKT